MVKRPRAARTKPGVPGGGGDSEAEAVAQAEAPGAGHNKVELTPDEQRALFVHHRTRWNEYLAKKKLADDFKKEIVRDLKNDGFSVNDMKIADKLVDDEDKIRDEVEQRLRVAAWLGMPMGTQLSMFTEPDRTPLVERAFEDGKTAGLEGRPRKPPFSPENPGYEQWMNGFYEGQKILGAKFAGDNKAAADAVADGAAS